MSENEQNDMFRMPTLPPSSDALTSLESGDALLLHTSELPLTPPKTPVSRSGASEYEQAVRMIAAYGERVVAMREANAVDVSKGKV
jgi:hypothetical protein